MNKWSVWKPMPEPTSCRGIEAPHGPGVYQVKSKVNNEFILFGISVKCRKRMKSLYPAPYGTGKRNNAAKRLHILENWEILVYRTMETETRPAAKAIEDILKAKNNHRFNT